MRMPVGTVLLLAGISASLVMAQPPREDGQRRGGEQGERGERGPRGPRGEGDRGPRGEGERPDGRGGRGFGSRDGRPSFGGGGGFSPLFRALDVDGDGKLSKEEIANAVKVLQSLDKDGDGELTLQEIMPPREEGERRFGEGGPRGPGGPGFGGFGGGAGFGGNLIEQFDKDGDGKLSKDEVPERMRDNFDRFDLNNDGFIDADEVTKMMENLREAMRERFQQGQGRPGGPGPGPGPGGPGGPRGERPARPAGPGPGDASAIEARMKELDKDGDGKISYDEAPERMKQAFERLDLNNDGYIDMNELRQMMDRVRQGGPGRPGSN